MTSNAQRRDEGLGEPHPHRTFARQTREDASNQPERGCVATERLLRKPALLRRNSSGLGHSALLSFRSGAQR